jgi:transcription initiation factor TFIIB
MNNAALCSVYALYGTFFDDDASAATSSRDVSGVVLSPRAHCACGAPLTGDLVDGNVVCTRCSLVLTRQLDSNAEWRFFGGSEGQRGANLERCGMPTNPLMPNLSMASIMSASSAHESMEVRKIRRYQRWCSMPYRERALYHVIDAIAVRSHIHGISQSIVDEAKHLYKQVSERRLSRGENRNGLIASTLYMALKAHGVTRSCKEVARIFDIKVSTMTRGCKQFQAIMNYNVVCTQPTDFLMRFCNRLNLPEPVVHRSAAMLERVQKHCIVSENAPPTICATVIYAACLDMQHPMNKRRVAEASDLSEVSITKCHKKIREYQHYLELDPDDRGERST